MHSVDVPSLVYVEPSGCCIPHRTCQSAATVTVAAGGGGGGGGEEGPVGGGDGLPAALVSPAPPFQRGR